MKIFVMTVSLVALAATPFADARADASREEMTGAGTGAVLGAVVGGPVGLILGGAAGAVLGDSATTPGVPSRSWSGCVLPAATNWPRCWKPGYRWTCPSARMRTNCTRHCRHAC